MNGSDEQDMVDELEDYRFPAAKLRRSVNVAKQPIALVACGSFSPVISSTFFVLFSLILYR